jgi:hypothetical protein
MASHTGPLKTEPMQQPDREPRTSFRVTSPLPNCGTHGDAISRRNIIIQIEYETWIFPPLEFHVYTYKGSSTNSPFIVNHLLVAIPFHLPRILQMSNLYVRGHEAIQVIRIMAPRLGHIQDKSTRFRPTPNSVLLTECHKIRMLLHWHGPLCLWG